MARRFDVRAYRVTNQNLMNRSVEDLEAQIKDARGFILRIRRGSAIIEAEPSSIIQQDDVIAVATRQEVLVERGANIGPEVDDKALLDFPVQILDVVITNKALAGKTLSDLAADEVARGVFLRNSCVAGGKCRLHPERASTGVMC